MPKRSYKQVEALMKQAFELLDNGLTKEEVAQRLGTTLRTVQRWTKDGSYQPAHQKTQKVVKEIGLESIIKNADNVPKLPINDINSLEDYIGAQKLFAISSGRIVVKYLPLLDAAISELNSSDINPRNIPSLIKSCIELIEVSSDCWARATGLDEVLNAVQSKQDIN
jgi:transcriptional regulator with XRE-family HTH domain